MTTDPKTTKPEWLRGLSPAQIGALGNVAFGKHGYGVSRRTLEVLERRGLIERHPMEKTDRLGTVRWDEWTMPMSVHIDFCEWCSQLVEGGGSE